MNRSRLKYYIDIGMGITFLLSFITGLMKWPSKVNGVGGPRLISTLIHDFSGLFLGLFVFIHLLLNLDWIICMCMTKKNLLNKVKVIVLLI
jgi:hypothetical protein